MSPEAQRIAIAKACGWKRQNGTPITYGGSYIPSGWLNPKGQYRINLPDYLTDLNAMHEAEKVLTVEQEISYPAILRSIIQSRHYLHINFAMYHATAAQRAEAFLRSIGKWQPTQQGAKHGAQEESP